MNKNNKLKIIYCFLPLIIFYILDYISVTFLSNLLPTFGRLSYGSAIKHIYIVKGIIIAPVLFLVSTILYKKYTPKKIIFLIMISIILEFILSGIVYIFIRPIFSSFGLEHGMENYSIYAAKILLISSSIIGIQYITSTYFLFLKRFKTSIFLFLTRQILILIPLSIMFRNFWHLKGILFSVPTTDVLSIIICILFFIITSKKI